MTDLLLLMVGSSSWRRFSDGLGRYEFLPGEFDYFLSQQGVNREDVMKGVRDIAAKARLEQAMDERRTGEEDYRRRLADARAANPQRPGRPIAPFGLTKAEAKAQVNGEGSTAPPHHPALGSSVRRYTNTGGQTTRKPSESLPPVERLRRAAFRLDDDDLSDLVETLKIELKRRKRKHPLSRCDSSS
jgi:hypothetical protein